MSLSSREMLARLSPFRAFRREQSRHHRFLPGAGCRPRDRKPSRAEPRGRQGQPLRHDRPAGRGRRRALRPYGRRAGGGSGLDERSLDADGARGPPLRARRDGHERLRRPRPGARARDGAGGTEAADPYRAFLRRGARLPGRAFDGARDGAKRSRRLPRSSSASRPATRSSPATRRRFSSRRG